MKIFLHKTGIFAIVLLIANLFFIQGAFSQTTYTWTGASGTSWATTGNWSHSGGTGTTFPGTQSTDIVVIPSTTNKPTLSTALTTSIASLTFTSTTNETLTITGQTLTVTGAVTLNSLASTTTAGTITGTGTLSCGSVQVGTSVTTTSTATFTTTMTSTISVFNITGTGDLALLSCVGSNANRRNNATFLLTSGTLTVNGQITTSNENGANVSTFTLGTSSPILNLGNADPFGNLSGTGTNTITLNGTGATVNYDGDGTGGTSANQSIDANAFINLTVSGSGVKTLTGAVTMTGALTVNTEVTLALSSFALGSPTSVQLYGGDITAGSVISGTGTLTLAGNVTVSDATTGTNDANISCPLALGSSVRTFTVADDGTSASDLTISSVVSGSGGVTKAGTGTMVLSGTNTYTGASSISAGILSVNTLANSGTSSSLGTGTGTSTISIGASGTLQYTGSGSSSSRAITLSASGGTIDASGTGTLTLSGNVSGNTFGLVLTGTGVGVESGVIGTTSGTVTKNSSGTWTLSGTNTYTGTTSITGGTVSVNNNSSLGSGTIAFTNTPTLTVTASISLSNAITLTSAANINLAGGSLQLTGAITGGGGIITAGSDLILNSSNTNAIGPITVNSNRLFVFGAISVIANSTISVANGATVDFGLAAITLPGTSHINLASGACLANRGTGTLTVSTTTVTFPSTGSIIFNSDDQVTTTLTVTGNYPTLTGNLTMQIGGNNTTVGAVTLSGAISGTGFGINKTFNGTLVLSGANSYTGGTTISAGNLTIGSTTALGSSAGALSISSGATATASSSVTVGSMALAGSGTANGTWGSTASSATFKNSTYFGTSATGLITVGTDTRTAPTVTVTPGTYTYNAASQGPASSVTTNTGTGTSYTFSYQNNGGTTYGPTATQPTNAGNYFVTATVAASTDGFYSSASSSATAFAINARVVTLTGSRIYDGTNTATSTILTISNNLDAGNLTLSGSGTLASANVGSEAISAGTLVLGGSAASNYTLTGLSGSVTISAKALTAVGTLVFSNKVYNGNTTATPTGTAALQTTEAGGAGTTTDGIPYSVDAVSLTGTAAYNFNSKDVATATTVTESGLSLTGTGNGNYTLTAPTSSNSITAKALTAIGTLVFSNKVYNGNTTATPTGAAALQATEAAGAGAISDGKPYSVDAVSLTGTAAYNFNSKDVATATTITESGLSLTGTGNGNYTLTAPTSSNTITAKALTAAGTLVFANKVYDGTTTSTPTGAAALQTTEAAGAGTTADGKPYSVDAVSLTGTAAYNYNSKDVATATTITESGLSLTGTGNGNYTLTAPTSSKTITAKALTVTGTLVFSNKAYDGSTTTTPTSGSPALQSTEAAGTGTTLDGIPYSVDAVSLTGTATYNFNTKDVATATTIIESGLTVTGTGNTNYTLTTQVSSNNITPRPLTAASSETKVYDGTTAAGTVTVGTVSNLVGTETLVITPSSTVYSGANVGSSYSVTISYSLANGTNGGVATNYSIASLGITNAAITTRALTAASSETKVYDGTTAAGTITVGTVSNLVSGQTLTITPSSTSYPSATVGSSYSVTISYSLADGTGGGLAANYSMANLGITNASITSRSIQVSGTRIYDATTIASSSILTITNNADGANLTLSGSGILSAADVGTRTISNATTVTRVQSAVDQTSTFGSTTITPTFTSAPVNGNTLVAVISTRGTTAGQVTSITETNVTNWARVAQSTNTNGSTTEIWYAPNISSANANITVHMGGTSNAAVVIMEYSGVLTASAVDQTASTTGSGTSGSTGTTATTAQANELLIGGIALVNSGYTLGTPTNSFTQIANEASGNFTASSNSKIYALERIVSSTGTYVSGGTISTSSQWSGAMATFKATLSSGTPLVLGGSAAGNYTLNSLSGSVIITAKALTESGLTASNKVYTGTNAATLTGTAALQTSEAPGAGTTADGKPYTGDVVSVTNTTTGTFASVNVANGIAVTPTGQSLSGADAGDYSLTSQSLSANITPAHLNITAGNQNVSFGTPVTTITGAGTYTPSGFVNSENSSVISGTVTYTTTYTATTAAGTSGVTITPVVTGLSATNYDFTPVNGTVTIGTAALTVFASPQSKTYGQTAPTSGTLNTNFTISSGLQNSDAVSGVTLGYSGSPSGDQTTAGVGSYTITPFGLTLSSGSLSNYTITYNTNMLTVNPANLSITATDQNKTYGGTVSTTGVSGTTFTSTGLQNGETVTVALGYSGSPSGDQATAGVGSYTITPSVTGGTYNPANYNTIGYTNGTLTVNPANLSITASAQSKNYGDVVSTTGIDGTTFTSTGLQNGETVTVALGYSGSPSGDQATAGVGSYTITPSATGGTYNPANYNAINYTNGTLTVTPAALTVTADDKTVNYGDATPTLTYTITGFVNSEDQSSATTGAPSLATTYTSGTPASASPIAITITANTLTSTNYTLSYVNGQITVNSVATTWNGGTSNDWADGTNWSNGLPTQYIDAVISSSATNMPSLTGNVTVHDLTLQSTSTLTINNNTFTIDGAVSGSGTLTGSPVSNLIIGGTAGTLNFTPGATVLYNLILNDNTSATLGSQLDIYGGPNGGVSGTLTVGSSAVFNTGDALTLKSNDSNTAIIASIPENGSGVATGTINGKVTVERNIHSSTNGNPNGNGSNNYVNGNAKRAWRLITAPVAGGSGSPTIFNAWQNNGIVYDNANPATQGVGTLITAPSADPATNGMDYASNFSMYTWDSGHQAFSGVTNTLTNISTGSNGSADNTGYFIFIRGDRNLATLGNPNYGGLIIDNTTLSSKGTLQTGRQVFNIKPSIDFIHNRRYTLVGNPYASPIDLSKLTINNVIKTYYTWNPNLNTVGAFVTISDDGSGNHLVVSTAGAGINNQDTIIQSGQAFFVLGDINSTTGSVTIDENDKVNANNNYVFRPASGASVTQSFRSNLYLLNPDSSTLLADGNLAQYNNLYSAGVDYMDALKFGNLNESLGLLRNGALLAIERRPIITANDTLFLNLTKTTARSYQFQFDATQLNNPGLVGFLKDSYNGDSVMLNLTGITTVNFSINSGEAASQNPNRFMIVFKLLPQEGPLPVTFSSVKATAQNNNIAVNWNVENEINIKSYEVEKSTDGITFTKVAAVKATGGSSVDYNWLDVNAVNGENYYRIRSIGNNGSIQYSQVVKVKIAMTANPMIALYTNPVTDGIVALQFTNMPKGVYSVNMMSAIGQVIATKTINHAGGSTIETLPLGRGIAKGTYELQVVKPGNSTSSFKVEYQ